MGKGGGVQETAQEKELKKISIERWNDHQSRILPFENKAIGDMTRSPEAMKERAAGSVNADMAQKVGAMQTAPGANPNSGRALSVEPVANVGRTMGSAQVQSGQNIEDSHAKSLQSVVDIGSGKAAQAIAGYGNAASNAVKSAVTDAEIAQANKQAVGSAIMTGLGGAAAVGKNMANAPAGNLSEFSTEGQQAVIAGASPGPGGYSYSPTTGALRWN